MQLDKRSSVPLYAQLKNLLVERIENGDYLPGTKIPTELTLCSELELSRPTVRQAIAELVSEGLLQIRKGKGTFVCSEPPRTDIENFNGFTFSFLNSGGIKENRFLDYSLCKKLPPEIRPIFFAEGENGACYELAWLLKADEQDSGAKAAPFAFCISYIPQSMFPDLDRSIRDGRSMRDITNMRYAFLPQQAKYKLFVRAATNEEARVLDVSRGTPLLISQSAMFARNGEVCEFNQTAMRYEFVNLTFDS